MTNMTPAAISHLSDEDLAELPLDTHRAVFEQIASDMAALSTAKRRIISAVEARYADEMAGVNTGSVTIERGDTVVTVTRPKNVSWDQDGLEEAARVLMEEWGEAPSDYMGTKYAVAEAAYNSWPPKIRDLFTPARTVRAGATALKFKDAK